VQPTVEEAIGSTNRHKPICDYSKISLQQKIAATDVAQARTQMSFAQSGSTKTGNLAMAHPDEHF